MLDLRPQQIDQVNKVLKTMHEESRALEVQHTDRDTDDAGHLIIKIKPYPAQVAKLEDRLWSQLDGILDRRQQSIARFNLKLEVHDPSPGTVVDASAQGFFGWGKDGAQIELWRVGTWYHWKINARNFQSSSNAPELPVEYRRFWPEPAKNAK